MCILFLMFEMLALKLIKSFILGFAGTDSLPRNTAIEIRNPSIIERLGAMTDRLLEKGFVAWGRCELK